MGGALTTLGQGLWVFQANEKRAHCLVVLKVGRGLVADLCKSTESRTPMAR